MSIFGRAVFLSFIVFLSANCYGLILSQYESTVLNQFFRAMLLQYEGGYVLNNVKPVCIVGFHVVDRFEGENPHHKLSVVLREGATIWKRLVHQNSDNEIIIHTYDREDSAVPEYVHILFINKPLFLQTVQENLPLFQYVLGPTVNPHELLNKLTDSNETFHSVLKKDTVLIGILLGFGTQNALYGSRTELLQDQLLAGEKPPMKNSLLQTSSMCELWKKEILLQNHSLKGNERASLQPSFSFSSTQEELSNLFKQMTVSSPQLSENRPVFIFGRLVEHTETDLLIQKLEIAQKKILALLSSERFLQQVLAVILPNERIEIINDGVSPDIVPHFTAAELKLLHALIAKGILEALNDEDDNFLQGLILGMHDANSNSQSRFDDNVGYDYKKMKILKIAQNNIKQADFYFECAAQEQNLICISPQKLLYRCLEEGTGAKLDAQTEVTIHCKIETPKSLVIADTWDDNHPIRLHLDDMIPGFVQGMQGMKVGETRELFIHPSVGYGIYTFLEKGIYLKARVKLIAIHDVKNPLDLGAFSCDDSEDAFAVLNKCNFAELSKITGYRRGHSIWNHYKHEKQCSLEQVLNQIHTKNENIDYESKKNQNLLNRLHWRIYQVRESD